MLALRFHLVVLAITVACTQALTGATLQFELSEGDIVLRGKDARLQLVVSQRDGDSLRDVSHCVSYSVQPEGIIDIDNSALVVPLTNGAVTVSAQTEDGLVAQMQLTVSETDNEPPLSFPSRIVPIFTKLGCNSGGCHGKAAGQNGFKLSLLGFEPRNDYQYIVAESRSRRVSHSQPDHSLLLTKATGQTPHGGGQRLVSDSYEYRMLRRWIAQGVPYGNDNPPQVVSIEVLPSQRRLFASATQQLCAIAHFSDGSREDVTRAAVFQSNDPEMADVSTTGLVTLKDLVGDVAIMARYQGQVTAFRADIPFTREATSETVPPVEMPQPNNLIDTFVFKKLKSLDIPVSTLCDDATFLRRASLDIAGRLPTLDQIHQFESDTSTTKRQALVDRLLESPGYADYFANKWNTILRNRRRGNELSFATVAFHQWIRDRIRQNVPYDEFVRAIITASGSVASNPPVAWYQHVTGINERVEDAAQLFLGQRVQCARCHHHPFEKWSQADYARLSAFFTTVSQKGDRDPAEPLYFVRVGGASAPHPKSGQALTPAGLDAPSVAIPPDQDPRTQLADWMTDPTNPFFARALVNRYWKHFLGRGIVEPEDDLRVTNPPSNPELLDGLAAAFIESRFDTKQLIRLIVLSKTYQLSSEPLENNLADRRSYSRFYAKRLPAEVLLDAVDHVTQSQTVFDGMPVGTSAISLPDTNFASYFLQVFGRPTSSTACECERSQDANLAQSLHLLNSEDMQKKLSSDTGRAAKLLADTTRPQEEKIRELYHVALSRTATDNELKSALTYLSEKQHSREAYEDLVWSLINSKEFLFNH